MDGMDMRPLKFMIIIRGNVYLLHVLHEHYFLSIFMANKWLEILIYFFSLLNFMITSVGYVNVRLFVYSIRIYRSGLIWSKNFSRISFLKFFQTKCLAVLSLGCIIHELLQTKCYLTKNTETKIFLKHYFIIGISIRYYSSCSAEFLHKTIITLNNNKI